MITIDITVVIQIINILILIVVMNAVLYKPVRSVLAKRKEKLAELANSIETFKKNTELRKDEISRKLNDARSRAKEEIEKSRSAAQATTAESLAKIRQDAHANKSAQLDEIKKQFADAQQQLSGQIDSFASDMAAKILGRTI
ncbi:MAG: ATP synthase subunit B' [Desulfobacterales bacterium SG8_35]|nr:MAG: ATP synthase subunit B' [Desulfobacterales bacterium SG8_35]